MGRRDHADGGFGVFGEGDGLDEGCAGGNEGGWVCVGGVVLGCGLGDGVVDVPA